MKRTNIFDLTSRPAHHLIISPHVNFAASGRVDPARCWSILPMPGGGHLQERQRCRMVMVAVSEILFQHLLTLPPSTAPGVPTTPPAARCGGLARHLPRRASKARRFSQRTSCSH